MKIILKIVDIPGIYLCDAIIRAFLVHHISFRVCGISKEHYLGGSWAKFSMFVGLAISLAGKTLAA